MKKTIITVAGLLLCLCSRADWVYTANTDAMTSKPTRFAMLQSNNSLDLNFPYKGENHGNLAVRQHPKQGVGVMFIVSKGQIICDDYQGCAVNIRFDEGKPARFNAYKSADHSSTIIGLSDPSRFIAAASKARRILVQVVMYQAGQQVLEFQTSKPLEWKVKK